MNPDRGPTNSKSDTIKLFHLQRKYFALMGIQPFSKNQPIIVLIRRILVFTPLILFAILSAVFLAYETKTVNEYADSFYGFAGATSIWAAFAAMLWKMDSLFKLIGDFENIIEQRKRRFLILL